METPIKNPLEWLKALNEVIFSTQCRIEHEKVELDAGCLHAKQLIETVMKKGKSIWWVGNGGSAAICSHLSQDLLNKLGARSFYLGDASLMTCMANDFGYEKVYLKPLEKLAVRGDLLIALSSSGNSENIVLCAKFATCSGMKLISFSGFEKENRLRQLSADLSFYVPAKVFGLVEVSHEAVLHSIIEWIWAEKEQV